MQGDPNESDAGEKSLSINSLDSLDCALQDWQQGDVIRAADLPFMHLADAEQPLTPEAKAVADIETDDDDWLLTVPTVTPGLAVVSQTCDVVKPATERPYVELSPLQSVSPDVMVEVVRGDRPRFAYLPGLGNELLVVDLDRVMTVEKAILNRIAGDQRFRGCATEAAVQAFGKALARKRARFAFPDDFQSGLRKIQSRVRKKTGKPGGEGTLYANCQEIRVHVMPTWTNPIRVELLFLFDSKAHIPGDAPDILESLSAKFTSVGVFTEISARAEAFDDITAKHYIESYPLDLEHLSMP